MSCPRCKAGQNHCRIEHEGTEQGELVWTVFYCQRCAFTWRDSEPPESIDHEKRGEWFEVDTDKPEQYPHNIPPAKTEKSK